MPGENVFYQPVFLKGLKDIAAHMGVGLETVRQWLDDGAPIVVENSGGRKRYAAEAVTLFNWRLRKSRELTRT